MELVLHLRVLKLQGRCLKLEIVDQLLVLCNLLEVALSKFVHFTKLQLVRVVGLPKTLRTYLLRLFKTSRSELLSSYIDLVKFTLVVRKDVLFSLLLISQLRQVALLQGLQLSPVTGLQVLDVDPVCLLVINAPSLVFVNLALQTQNLLVQLQDLVVELLFVFLLLIYL